MSVKLQQEVFEGYSLREIYCKFGNATRRTAQQQAGSHAHLLWRQEVSRDETQVSWREVDIEDWCSFGGERLHQVATRPCINGVPVIGRKERRT